MLTKKFTRTRAHTHMTHTTLPFLFQNFTSASNLSLFSTLFPHSLDPAADPKHVGGRPVPRRLLPHVSEKLSPPQAPPPLPPFHIAKISFLHTIPVAPALRRGKLRGKPPPISQHSDWEHS